MFTVIFFICKNSNFVIHLTVFRAVYMAECFRAVYIAKSVFDMLTKIDFKKVGRGVRMDFVLYFHQSHAWIWFKIAFLEPKKSIWNCRTPMQNNSSILAVMAFWMTWSRCQFHTKQSRYPWYWVISFCGWKMGLAHDTVQMKFSNIKIIWTKTCRFDGDLFSAKLSLPYAQY